MTVEMPQLWWLKWLPSWILWWLSNHVQLLNCGGHFDHFGHLLDHCYPTLQSALIAVVSKSLSTIHMHCQIGNRIIKDAVEWWKIIRNQIPSNFSIILASVSISDKSTRCHALPWCVSQRILFFSRCFTIQIQTAPQTTKRRSSTGRTVASTRRRWRPSCRRAGMTTTRRPRLVEDPSGDGGVVRNLANRGRSAAVGNLILLW